MGLELYGCPGVMGEECSVPAGEVEDPRRLDDMNFTFALHELYNNSRIRASAPSRR